MNLILKLLSYKHAATAMLLPDWRIKFLKHYSFLPFPKKASFPKNKNWYRLLTKGILSTQGVIDCKKESQIILKDEDKFPLVSCLLVTKNRFDLAKKSIHCFLNQSYPNRELVIINDDTDTQLLDWVNNLNSCKIRFYHLPDESKKLGVLRNFSREKANGKYIAQWDDDDLSHNNRLLFQMTIIIKFNLDGCSLQREQLWFPAKKRFGFSSRRLWEGSMIAKNDRLPLYHKTRRGEESDAVNNLSLNGKIALLDFPELYTYCFHGNNTWDESHFENIWETATKVFGEKDYLEKINELTQIPE